jgi:hypothetical protein
MPPRATLAETGQNLVGRATQDVGVVELCGQDAEGEVEGNRERQQQHTGHGDRAHLFGGRCRSGHLSA